MRQVFDSVALLFCTTVAVGVSVVPVCSHSVSEKQDWFPSPYSSRVVFLIRLLVVGEADEEGLLLEKAPFVD